MSVARWGEVGLPFLIYPPAGGHAEEIERFLVIDTLAPYLEAGLIKVYSCDSIAGRAMLSKEGSPQHQMRLLDLFLDYVGFELVPAIQADCGTDEIPMLVGGSSIGAYSALATLCRFPGVFTKALCMSGTYDLSRFLKAPTTDDFFRASPVHFLPHLEGPRLEALRSCFVLLASGEGAQEDIGESWRVAAILGSKGIPNRVDSWGTEWKHDWPTWRNMLHRYTPELAGAAETAPE